MKTGLLLILAAALPGCDPPKQQGLDDLATAADLGAQPDLTAAPDLSALPDLTTPPDMTRPKLTGAPTDCAAGVTADTLFNTEVKPKCAVANCHGTPGFHYSLTTVAEMKAKWVGKTADQPNDMVYVTASDLDRSYVMYKLLGQQLKAAPDPLVAGDQMPKGGTALTHDSLCRFISWINGGAL